MIAVAEPMKLGLTRSKPIRIMIVDDSVVMRRLLANMLSETEGIEVAGWARDGIDALQKMDSLKPNLITLDVEMPGPSGIETMRTLRRDYPNTKVIMCSSLTARGSAVTVDALLAGADDFVTKQSSGHMNTSAYESLQQDLLASIARIFRAKAPVQAIAPKPKLQVALPQPFIASRKQIKPEILAIGISTGGPALLAQILPSLPADLRIPVVIVQHMPPFFTQLLAERLNKICKMPVYEAKEGMAVKPATMLLAPGDYHMKLVRKADGVYVALDQGERENSCRPAVDVLFRSVAEIYGSASLAAVLTGMGEDGLRGARVLKDKGACILAQDEASSVVWGMPGAVVNAGVASAVLTADEIVPEIMRRI